MNREELITSIENIKKGLGNIKRFVNFQNRKRFFKNGKMTDDLEIYFISLLDDEWTFRYAYVTDYVIDINLVKRIPIENIEDQLENIIDRMYEIKYRLLKIESLDSKFLIYFNGIDQQIVNKESYREPIYTYQGIGDSTEDTVFVSIKYNLI
jgi:hypothetical protein